MRHSTIDYSCLEPTVVPVNLAAADDAAGQGPSTGSLFADGVQVIDDRQPNQPQGSILRTRLAAAALVLMISLLAIFAQGLWRTIPVEPSLTAAVLTTLAGILLLLHGPRPLSLSQLRIIEVGLFGSVGIVFYVWQCRWLEFAISRQDALQMMAIVGHSTLGFAIMMLAYGMFIPNGWKRTTLMLIPPLLLPMIGLQLARWQSTLARDVLTPGTMIEAGLLLAVSAAIAIFGTATIARLRHEVRKAQKFGQYHLQSVIGQGGMGDVYLAEHQLLKRPCAMKLVRTQELTDPLAMERFEREVCSMARLSHPHTVDVYDYGRTADGTFYYVMEYLPGLNLQELVKQHGPLPPERVIHFLQQVCSALEEAHRLGMVHRDLKPANIFAAERGGEFDFTKLLDFGLVMDDARADWLTHHSVQQVSPFAGSPLYSSPEQVQGSRDVDARSDIYSLGATGYFLLTGRPPFIDSSPLRVLMAHVSQPVTPPSQLCEGVPFDLEQILLRCLAKSPDDRFDSVTDLKHALQYCQDAGLWTSDRAADWWQVQSPEPIVEPLCHGHYCGMSVVSETADDSNCTNATI